ncbi:GreA/GreB family elongation factor [Microbacterium sp. 179-B 1A2 NHS]|uniref:GreA/GreB family elongation factor n=1 Tax=Microbacterium sp. 179-B 1A2 NHS TaxID=3142383 RepID=UPI0039A27357
MSDNRSEIWMTEAALAALQEELARLEAAPQEEAAPRLVEVRDLIRRAETGAKPDDGLVEPGMTVTVRFAGDDQAETFLLGERALFQTVGDTELDVYSPESPLGGALLGHHVGDTVRYTAPNGRELEVTVVAAAPFA